jgi:hypothetical protein
MIFNGLSCGYSHPTPSWRNCGQGADRQRKADHQNTKCIKHNDAMTHVPRKCLQSGDPTVIMCFPNLAWPGCKAFLARTITRGCVEKYFQHDPSTPAPEGQFRSPSFQISDVSTIFIVSYRIVTTVKVG